MLRLFLYLSLFLFSFAASAQKIKPFYGPFPEPASNKNMQFYLQRSVDRNTVIYELNYDIHGQLNKKKPIKVYWIDFEDGAKISPLTFMQSKLAYGIETELMDDEKQIYVLWLVSYKKIKFFLKPTGKNHQYQTHVTLKGKSAILSKLFIKIIGGTYFSPVISYIELTGNEVQTGKQIVERIKPNKD